MLLWLTWQFSGKTNAQGLTAIWNQPATGAMSTMQTLDLVIAITAPSTDLVGALLLAPGELIALGLTLIDEVDNACGDAYSGAVAGHSLRPSWSVRQIGMGFAAAGTAWRWYCPCMHWRRFYCC